MMRVLGGTDIESGALILIADVEAFGFLSKLLRLPAPTDLKLDPVVGRSAIRPIGALRFEDGEHVASIQINGGEATLRGDIEGRRRLADDIEEFLAHNDLDEPGVHTHIDTLSTTAVDASLAPNSVDLVLAGPVSDELA